MLLSYGIAMWLAVLHVPYYSFCHVVDECGLCDGDNYLNSCTDSDSCTLMDCTGQCYGESTLDECGVCNGDGYTCNAPEAADFPP